MGIRSFPWFDPMWHEPCFKAGVLIAIPNCQGRVSPVFDTASRLLVVRRHRGREVERNEFVLGALALDALARSVAELGVNVLLCAAISEQLRLALERAGVRVEPHLCGEVEVLLAAFCAGNCRRSEFQMPGCCEGNCCGNRRARLARPSRAEKNR